MGEVLEEVQSLVSANKGRLREDELSWMCF